MVRARASLTQTPSSQRGWWRGKDCREGTIAGGGYWRAEASKHRRVACPQRPRGFTDGGKEVVDAARYFESFCVSTHGVDPGFASLGVGPCKVSLGREFVPMYVREEESCEDVGQCVVHLVMRKKCPSSPVVRGGHRIEPPPTTSIGMPEYSSAT